MANMRKEYGAKKAERVFYASRNSGKISGVDPESTPGASHPVKHMKRTKTIGDSY